MLAKIRQHVPQIEVSQTMVRFQFDRFAETIAGPFQPSPDLQGSSEIVMRNRQVRPQA
jgi:hypothetical protein